MSDIKKLFRDILLEQDDELFPDRNKRVDRNTSFPEDDKESFNSGLDLDSDPSEFDTDGLGFDAIKASEDNFAEVYQKVYDIDRMVKSLIDPTNEKNLSKLLSIHDRSDSIGNGLVDQLKRPILKASNSLTEVKNMLDQTASLEPSLKRKIDALKVR